MRADNSHHVVAAARRRADQTRQRAIQALQRITATGKGPITFEAVAREAGVSRSWLYSQVDLRAEIDRLRRRQHHGSTATPPPRQRASDASLLQRLEAATARVRHLEHDNQELRRALEHALGAIRTEQINRRPTGTGDTPGGSDTPRDQPSRATSTTNPRHPPELTSTTPPTTHPRRSEP